VSNYLLCHPFGSSQSNQDEDMDFINHVRAIDGLPALNSVGAFAIIEPKSSLHDEVELEPANYVEIFDGPRAVSAIQRPIVEEIENKFEDEVEDDFNDLLNQVFDDYESKDVQDRKDPEVVSVISDEEVIPEEVEESEIITTEDTVLVSFQNINFTHGDMNRIRNGLRLNDNAIEIYLKLLIHSTQSSMFYAFSTGYYPPLENSRRPNKPAQWVIRELASADKYLIPIFHQNEEHWSLIFIDTLARNVFHFDSLFSPSKQILSKIKNHFNNCIPKLNNLVEWNSNYLRQVPQQQNAIDCGVFLCLFARHSIFGQAFNFQQSDISEWRRRMENEIINLNISF
jgi:Ulp1 family protease